MRTFLNKHRPALLGLLVAALIIALVIVWLKHQSLKPEKHKSGAAPAYINRTL
jgi:hypothetical protein